LTVEPPEVAAWLDATLGRWLRQAFANRDTLEVDVHAPEGSPPTAQILVRGLNETLPDAHALQASLKEAIAAAKEAATKALDAHSGARRNTGRALGR
jgi:hypothetical protein